MLVVAEIRNDVDEPGSCERIGQLGVKLVGNEGLELGKSGWIVRDAFKEDKRIVLLSVTRVLLGISRP